MITGLSFDDLEMLFTDTTLLGSAHEKGLWGSSFVSVFEQGNESSTIYPSAARIVQLILDDASACLKKLEKSNAQGRSCLENISSKRPFIYQSDSPVDIIENAPAYLADHTQFAKPLCAEFLMAALRVKSVYMEHHKVKHLDLDGVKDPIIRSAIRVAAAFENLYRAGLVREPARTESAIVELHEATLASLEELSAWASPKKCPIPVHKYPLLLPASELQPKIEE
jgi:hypothetical protein